MLRQLNRAGQPALTALAVHWQMYEDERGRMSAEDEAVFALGTVTRPRTSRWWVADR